MHSRNRLAKFVVTVAAALMLVVGTDARAESPSAGSVLIFPLFDSSPGSGTVICVTNTETDQSRCSDDTRGGDVSLHYVYYDGTTCREFDRYELLTPADTLCVLADEHNPEGEIGFLMVMALNPVTNEPYQFDHLVGQAIVVQSGLNFSWSYTPPSFRALATPGGTACSRVNPDSTIGDGDGAADFNGAEYEAFPRELVVPTFFEEDDNFGNQLTVMSTAGDRYVNEVRYLIYNNIEDPYSRTQSFTCWFSTSLGEISQSAANLNGDPDELGHNTETGWVSVRGRTLRDQAGNPVRDDNDDVVVPPILGVFAQMIQGTDFAMGDSLYGRDGYTDGLELPHGNRDFDGVGSL